MNFDDMTPEAREELFKEFPEYRSMFSGGADMRGGIIKSDAHSRRLESEGNAIYEANRDREAERLERAAKKAARNEAAKLSYLNIGLQFSADDLALRQLMDYFNGYEMNLTALRKSYAEVSRRRLQEMVRFIQSNYHPKRPIERRSYVSTKTDAAMRANSPGLMGALREAAAVIPVGEGIYSVGFDREKLDLLTLGRTGHGYWYDWEFGSRGTYQMPLGVWRAAGSGQIQAREVDQVNSKSGYGRSGTDRFVVGRGNNPSPNAVTNRGGLFASQTPTHLMQQGIETMTREIVNDMREGMEKIIEIDVVKSPGHGSAGAVGTSIAETGSL